MSATITWSKYCMECGVHYLAGDIRSKLCSDKCRKDRDKNRLKKYFQDHLKIVPKKMQCPHCHTLFLPKHGNQKFCSKQCQTRSNYPQQKIWRQVNPEKTRAIAKRANNKMLKNPARREKRNATRRKRYHADPAAFRAANKAYRNKYSRAEKFEQAWNVWRGRA